MLGMPFICKKPVIHSIDLRYSEHIQLLQTIAWRQVIHFQIKRKQHLQENGKNLDNLESVEIQKCLINYNDIILLNDQLDLYQSRFFFKYLKL